MGWVCTYTPEELLHAAGFLPVRVIGGCGEIPLGEAEGYLYRTTCSAMRTLFQLGLNKGYDFLDGLVTCTTCDSVRRFADNWRHYALTPFTHILTLPHKITEPDHRFWREQVVELKDKLEQFSGVRITPERLKESISLFNETRGLLKALAQTRKWDYPPITGSELLEIVNAGVRMPKEQFNPLLRQLLKQLPASPPQLTGERKPRIMLGGSLLNNSDFVKFIEGRGCVVVADELCSTSRYFWDLVDLDRYPDPIEALSRRYLEHFPCARMLTTAERDERIMAMVKDYRVQGLLYEVIRYCVHYRYDFSRLKRKLQSLNIPALELEMEYGVSGSGQLMTRVDAFIEMVGGG